MSDTDEQQWYWCLRHQAVERAGEGCANDQRMGPYPSRHEAEHWKERVDARNQAWEEEDRRWEDER